MYSDVLAEYLAYTRKKYRKKIERIINLIFPIDIPSDSEIPVQGLLDAILDDEEFSEEQRQNLINRLNENNENLENRKDLVIDALTAALVQSELRAGIQTIQYQINTLCTCNGQSPFVTIFMYLKPGSEYEEEHAMIIEEILRQRIQGVKNKQGVWITPTFPKLIYVLTEENNLSGGKYDYLTHIAATCTAKRIYPDYISEKVMKENYDGEVFGCIEAPCA